MMPCVCCHDDTVERRQVNRLQNIRDDDGEQASPSEYANCFLYCKSCGRGHSVDCVIQFIDRIDSGISPAIRNDSQWFRCVNGINFRPSKSKYYIERGICCSFKPSFSGVRLSTNHYLFRVYITVLRIIIPKVYYLRYSITSCTEFISYF